jgi:hypothetical protein
MDWWKILFILTRGSASPEPHATEEDKLKIVYFAQYQLIIYQVARSTKEVGDELTLRENYVNIAPAFIGRLTGGARVCVCYFGMGVLRTRKYVAYAKSRAAG